MACVDNLNSAMIFVEMEGNKERARPALWLSTYGLEARASTELAGRMQKLYDAALT
ncbi:MAG: hypothetical protein H0W08_14805 [Acidobacteria bacterium]|nr:hypothetical protein [Acidobacteriota bacterium]